MKKNKSTKRTPTPEPEPVKPPTQEPTVEEITRVAHSIWEEAGRPEGRDVEHWLEAESRLRQGRQAGPGKQG
jgi:hypothetical protein